MEDTEDPKPIKRHTGGRKHKPEDGPPYKDFASGKITRREYLDQRKRFYPGKANFTDDDKLIFLSEFAKCGLVGASAIMAGVSDETVRKHRNPKMPQYDSAFAEAYETAQNIFRESLSSECYRRAVQGWLEPVYQKGECVGEVRRYSERLLELLLKRYDPAFREKVQADVHITGGVLAVPSAPVSTEAWAAEFEGQIIEEAQFEDAPAKAQIAPPKKPK